MKTQKMSLANIKGKLSRAEMKNIMAGSGEVCNVGNQCWHWYRAVYGTCMPWGGCSCVSYGAGVKSYECDNIA